MNVNNKLLDAVRGNSKIQRFIDFSTRQINAIEKNIYNKTHDKFISVHKFHNNIEVLKYK